ncbi:hypothetical protein I4U23_020044 [Adineta vaga]|nr:hypothetical protein I4U23_020044 [Adineta vaga]
MSFSDLMSIFSKRDNDFQLVCLDFTIDQIDDDLDIDIKSFVKDVYTFNNKDDCLKHLNSHPYYRIYLIVSDRLLPSIFTKIEEMDHVVSIFVFATNNTSEDLKNFHSEKCVGTFIRKTGLILKVIEQIQMKTSIISETNVFSQVEEDQDPFLHSKDTCFFSLLADVNNAARSIIDDRSAIFEKQEMLRECPKHNSRSAVVWYTEPIFLFEIVNKALRTKSTSVIRKFRFFIKDLEESLDLLFAKQILDQWCFSSSSSINNKLYFVYRGQVLSLANVTQLQLFIGQRITMSQYVSTTKDIQVAESFAGKGVDLNGLQSVVYEIDTSIIYEKYDDKPDPEVYYYDISQTSSMKDEDEIIFRIGTIFKVLTVTETSENCWHVLLRLEKCDDYRKKTKANQTPMEVVQSFFYRASQQQNVDVENIINEQLSSEITLRMSVFIRMGHLIKHHPREQLECYQSVLAMIPSTVETNLLKVGYWAVRMRCISSVIDWTAIPLHMYRQTVLNLKGHLKKQLYYELARIDEARGSFSLAKHDYQQVLQLIDNHHEGQAIRDEIRRLDNKVDDIKPFVSQDQVAYWNLYVSLLKTGERAQIDRQCRLFPESIIDFHSSNPTFFENILSHLNSNEYNALINDRSTSLKWNSDDASSLHVIIKTLTDKPLYLSLEKDMTIRQLKQKIRCSFDIPYHPKHDFRLFYMGTHLSNEDDSIDDYSIHNHSIISLIHGPCIQDSSMNHLAQVLHEHTGLTSNDITRINTAEQHRIHRQIYRNQKLMEITMKLNETTLRHGSAMNEEMANEAMNEFFREIFLLSQIDDDDDADSHYIADMSQSVADEYLQHSGPQTSVFQLLDLMMSFCPDKDA